MSRKPPTQPPRILEYTAPLSMERWRVEKGEFLIAKFGLMPPFADQMTRLHAIASEPTFVTPWLIARRLFGIAPMILPLEANAEDYRTLTWEELGKQLNLGEEDMQANLDGLAQIWRTQFAEEAGDADAQESEEPQGDLPLNEGVLREFGFTEEMFKVVFGDEENPKPRPESENKLERDWFIGRCEQWRKMLSEPMAATTAREALMNDLYLRRISTEMAPLPPTSVRFKQLRKDKAEIETAFQKLLSDLNEQFPDMAVAGKMSFRGNLSDIIKAWTEYRARGDRKRIDRIRTAAEVEFSMRQSVQKPVPAIRFGQSVAIVEAIQNIYNPDFRSQFNHGTLRALDVSVRRSIEEMRQQRNEPLVDLEKGVHPGEGDDFPDFAEAEQPKVA